MARQRCGGGTGRALALAATLATGLALLDGSVAADAEGAGDVSLVALELEWQAKPTPAALRMAARRDAETLERGTQ
jgi:hypothetical protein